MNLLESFKISFRALNANKVRALLTMLGIIIGVASVILLVSIGTGVKDDLVGQFEGLGSNLLYVIPGNMEEMMTGGGGGSAPAGMNKRFRIDDVRHVQSKVKQATIVPYIESGSRASLGAKQMGITIAATDAQGSKIMNFNLGSGRYPNSAEVAGAGRVAVIGANVQEKFFGGRDPIGREIYVGGQRFEIIGIADKQGGMSAAQDSMIMMPYTTAQRVLNSQEVSMMIAKAETTDEITLIQAQIRQSLRPVFGTDFSVFSQDQMSGMIGSILGTLTYMLAGIAGIALLVGGIGIMNIMLVSVSERTREIGIRKAVGARTYDIMTQFVIEAVLLSVLGGVIGIGLGVGGSLALDAVVPTSTTGWAIALAFFFSAGTGVFFGVYPAWKAAKLDPIEALRYE